MAAPQAAGCRGADTPAAALPLIGLCCGSVRPWGWETPITLRSAFVNAGAGICTYEVPDPS